MNAPDETLSQPRFDTTQWSLVMQSQRQSSPEGQIALAELCQRYWYPLFAYVRALGHDVHQAQDLTQGFFERLIEKNYVGNADPARGKFRTFLLTSLTHFLANEHDKRTALKRGGDRKQFSLDFADTHRRLGMEPATGDCPKSCFEQQWARALLDRVVGELQQEYTASGKSKAFEHLKQYLTSDDTESAAVIGRKLGMSEAAVRVAAHRLRAEYRTRLRREIAATVGSPADVDDEIASLFAAFASH